MGKSFLLIILPVVLFFADPRDLIYRIAFDSYDSVGYSYNINILILKENKEYNLIEQKYISKKFARKNIPSRFLKTYGIWKIENDTLKLINYETKQEMLFIKKNSDLFYLFNKEEITNSHWVKIK